MLTPFAPSPGLDSDDTSFSAQGRWSDGNNVRFHNGQPQVVGQYEKVFSDALTFPNTLFAFTRSGATNLAIGTQDNGFLISTNNASPVDRSPASVPTSVGFWAFAAWGSTLLAVPTGGTLYEQSGTSAATAVAASPDNITTMLVTSQRQVLAFGCNEEVSGTFNGLCIRGSDLEDYTDWTTTSTNNAFEHILDGVGVIMGAALVGDYVAVWTNTSLYMGQFIGDPGQAYRFDKVDDDCGLIGQRAVTVAGGAAYWVDNNLNLRLWSPGALVQTVPCPVSRSFNIFSYGVARNNFVICHVPKFNEIWICCRGGANSLNIAVSLKDGTWFKSDIPILMMISSDLLYHPSGVASSTYFSDGIYVYGAECNGAVTAEGPTSWFLQSSEYYLDNSRRRIMVRGVIPDFAILSSANDTTNDAAVTLTLTLRDRPQSTAVTKTYTIAAHATKKDFRASGKIAAVKLSGSSASSNREMRIGKLLFDVVPMGER